MEGSARATTLLAAAAAAALALLLLPLLLPPLPPPPSLLLLIPVALLLALLSLAFHPNNDASCGRPLWALREIVRSKGMELEASTGLFGHCALAGTGGVGAWDYLFGGGEGFDGGDWDPEASMLLPPHGWFQQPAPTAVAPKGNEFCCRGEMNTGGVGFANADAVPVTLRKRQRTTEVKNSEDVASKRMTHIAVERNRRKQMNHYLAVLRSLMPPSYAQRGEQASIIGGAINFLKELEQQLQSLEAHKAANDGEAPPSPFDKFFTFPQYSMSATFKSKSSVVADVEVTMVETHANLRVLSRRRPMQLLRLVVALQGHGRLTVLHLNMTSSGQMVLYSLILKVEEDCQLTSVDEIATAAHQVLEKIQEEELACCLG